MGQLSIVAKLGYGVGHVLNDLCSSLWFTYLLIFLNKVERIPNTLAGVVLLVGQVADGISTPFVGTQADRTDDTVFCIKYGRRKTWHLAGTIFVTIAFPFIFMGCLGCALSEAALQVLYLAPFVVIFQFGWAAVQISHLALIPALTSEPHERTELNAIRYAFTVFSNITVYLITWLVLGVQSGHQREDIIGPNDATTFKIVVASVVCLGLLFSLVFHMTVKENNHQSPYASIISDDIDEEGDNSLQSASVQSASSASSYHSQHYASSVSRMLPSDWFKKKQFYLVAVLYMCTRLFCNLTQAYVPIYLQDTLELSPQSVAYIPLTMYVSGFITTTIAIKPINVKFGRKVSYALGSLLGAGGCVWIFFGSGELYCQYLVYPVAVLLGAGGSTMLVTSLSITADLIGNNIESGAFVYGAMSFTDKLSNGIAIMVIQYFSPYSPICKHCIEYYRYILAFVGGGTCVAGALSVLLLVTTIIKRAPQSGLSTTSSGGLNERICPDDGASSNLLLPAGEDDSDTAEHHTYLGPALSASTTEA
ncbi:major facilitator superfamily domain-containing protein 12-like [Hyalella azteca]|uniref:Major facilitator superfamily domain-containing protein 12-like n=1 Tax=Hyalella azteca TaxID=294128 RepID=A0A8B7NEG0_HYAAZ|nr:major facilitator superfamily domain-containing protein 12-like [Hyalella azteca]